MLIRGFFLFFLITCLPSFVNSCPSDYTVKKINKFRVSISQKVKDDLNYDNISIGSSLKFYGKEGNKYIFYAITDRGPNATFEEDGKNYVYIDDPNFTPSILKIELDMNNKTVKVVDSIQLKSDTKKVSGVKNSTASPHSAHNNEIAIDKDYKQLDLTNSLGLDTEGLAIDAKGNFYVSDEYFPSLNYVDKNGKILKTYKVGTDLPEIIKWRMPNRGFEGVAVAPNGKLYITLESILDIEGKTKGIAQFIRIIEFDPTTKKTRMFAYPFEQNVYTAPNKVRIGDIVSLSNEEFLIIEQGKKKNERFRNSIYKINLKNAIDISNIKLNNKNELEYGNLDEVKKYFIEKVYIFSARDYDWEYKKMEGVALVNKNTIALINDNDFGFKNHEIYIDSKKRKRIRLKYSSAKKQRTDLWLVEFEQDLK